VRWMFMRCMPPMAALLIFAALYILCAYVFCMKESPVKMEGTRHGKTHATDFS